MSHHVTTCPAYWNTSLDTPCTCGADEAGTLTEETNRELDQDQQDLDDEIKFLEGWD